MAAEENTQGLNLADFGYTSSHAPTQVDTRDVKPAYEMPELNIAPISYPNETPKDKERKAKAEIPSIVDRIRQSAAVTFADQSAMAGDLGADLRSASQPKGLVLHRNDVPMREMYDRLNDGSYVPRYESFIAGTDNEERLAKKQGAWDKWGRGLSKLVAKTALYGAGGIVNPVYGTIEAIKTGNFNAVYNNDFMKWMEDLDTRLNYSLANYYTNAEKQRSFLGKMGTANFWANDVLGGMAFTTGALVSEAFWASITGGASLASTAGRLGLRAAGETAGKALAKDAFSGVKSAANAYLRSASKASNVASVINNGRFLMTSAGWEASVEASHFMKEAELNFVNSYKNAYGKNPTPEELNDFRNQAANAGNTVFAANIGVVGLSNILQFGQYFGTGLDVASKIDRSINKAFGLGAKFSATGNLERVSASKLRKGLGVTYNLFKRPFTEGVWEEGTQGVIGETAKSWIKSRFDLEATQRNMDIIDSLKDGFAQTYGTPEGRMEVGIGALIGLFTGVGGGRSTGWGGITEYHNQSELLDAQISNYNSLDVPRSAMNLINRFSSLNQQISALDRGATAEENKDAYETRQYYNMALFSKFNTEKELGLLDDGAENFRYVLENMSNEDIANEYNISPEEASRMKEGILDDYNQRLDDFKVAQRLAESTGANSTGYKDYLALNAFLGMRSRKDMENTAESISELMGDPSYKNALMFYADLSAEGQRLFNEKSKLGDEVAKLESEIQKINSTIEEDGARERYAKKAEELSKVNQRLSDIDNELGRYRQSTMSTTDSGINSFSFSGTEFKNLDNISRVLRRSKDPADKYRADQLDVLSIEFAQLYADYKSVNEMFLRIRDPRFMAKEERGILKLFSGGGEAFDDSMADPELVSTNAELEEVIKKGISDGTLSDEEAYTLRTFSRMRLQYDNAPQAYDPISDESWEMYNQGIDLDLFRQQVADKVYDEVGLSPREERIYQNNKAEIDDINAAKGDSPMSRLRRLNERLNELKTENLKTAKDSNNKVIDDTISNASKEEQEQVRDAIDERNRIRNDQDAGKDVDTARASELEADINDFGNRHGVDFFLDFIEQNRQIDKGVAKFTPTVAVTSVEDLVDHRMPPGSSRGGASFDNAQNIEMLTAKKDRSGNNMIISGIKPKALVDLIIAKMGGRIYKRPGEAEGAWVLTIQGVDVRIYANSEHSSSKIPMADIERLQELSLNQSYGFIFTLQPALSSANSREVLWLDLDGSLSIVPTNTTYGKKGRDVISDQDVLNTKVGDRLIARIDFEDDYNKSLWNRYQNALKKYEKAVAAYKADMGNQGLAKAMEIEAAALENAKNNMRNNLVIKFINNENGDARFVSVAKGLPSTIDSSAGQQNLLKLREKAYGLFVANAASRKTGYMDVGTYSVSRTLPGRPSLNMRMVDGVIQVDYIPVTAAAAEHIVSVGYSLNGKLRVRDPNIEFSSHPFMSLVARESKKPGDKYYNVKVPYVIIKHPNGQNYAYPVQVGAMGNEDRISFADELEQMAEDDWVRLIERGDILGINTAAAIYGVNPEYFVRLSGTFGEIQSDMIRMAEFIRSMPNTLDVAEWLNSPRSSKEIAVDDVRININLENSPFHAPKLVANLGGAEESVVDINDPSLFADVSDMNDESPITSSVEEPQSKPSEILAPNGEKSLLYEEALSQTGSEESALKIWNTAYSDDFILYYGDWKTSPTDNQDLDANGEPALADVESFLENRIGIAPPLSDNDISSLRSIMVSNNISDVEELNQALQAFFKGDKVVVDKDTLLSSGLYDVDEINRIISNQQAMSDLVDLISKFNSMMLGVVPDRIRYLLTNEYEGNLDFFTDAYSPSGKKKYMNPYKVANDIRNAVGGIKDRAEFDAAFAELPYESLVERYQSDSEFADAMFEEYSALTKIAVVNGRGTPQVNSGFTDLITFAHYDQGAAAAIESDIKAITGISSDVVEEVWAEEAIIKDVLRSITRSAIDLGIDVIGLEDSYDTKTREEIEDFLLGLDVFVRSLAPGRSIDMDFVVDYDMFFGLGNLDREAVLLSEKEKNMNLVVYPEYTNALSDVDLFKSAGLLRLRDNIFHRVNVMGVDEMYNVLYDQNEAHIANYGSPAFPIGDTSGKSREEVISMIKEWINKNTRFDQTEQMALHRAAFGISLDRPSAAGVDIQRELNRFEERKKHDNLSSYDVTKLRALVLREKMEKTDLYNDVLYNISYDGGRYGLSLNNSDPMSLRDLDLAVSGEMREILLRAALNETSNIMDLFYLNNYSDIYRTVDFYRDLYQRHPELAPVIKGESTVLEDGKIKSFSSEDLIMTGDGVLMEKVAEDGGMSVYDSVYEVGSSHTAEVLQSYDKPLAVDDFIKSDHIAKESELNKVINNRSC